MDRSAHYIAHSPIDKGFTALLALLIAIFSSCVPVRKDTPNPYVDFVLDLDLNDLTNRLAYHWVDKMERDSILPLLDHTSAKKRLIACYFFGSNPDSNNIELLLPMLKDPDLSVRIAAIYALGQTGHIEAEKHLLNHWIDNDVTPGYASINAMILESIGKCGSKSSLKHMATMEKLVPSDTLLMLGQARGIFRYLLRGISLPSGTETMLNRLESNYIPDNIKMVSATYFSRLTSKELEPFLNQLIKIFKDQSDDYIKHCLLQAIGKVPGEASKTFLLPIAKNTANNPILRASALKALYQHPDDEVEQLMDKSLFDPNPHIQMVAGKYLETHGDPARGVYYYHRAKTFTEEDYLSKYSLLTAALKYIPPYLTLQRDSVSNYLKTLLKKTSNPIIGSLIISALSVDFNNMVFLKNLLVSNEDMALRSAAALGLGKMAAKKDFESFFKSYAPESRAFIAKYLSQILFDPNHPLMAPAAQALIDGGPELRIYLPDSLDLMQTMSKLSFPRQFEDYKLLHKLFYTLYPDSIGPEPLKPTFNNPINWDLFSQISSSPKITMLTTRGTIEITLFPNIAPATVIHFVNLVKSSFYTNKYFHRVEPNFVIQGGCTRGDGYGSIDVSVRTESPPVYFDQSGLVGLASAGRHTESQQFFITLFPALHLDGNFTIFGKVTQGLDVLYKIKPGDKIESMYVQIQQ